MTSDYTNRLRREWAAGYQAALVDLADALDRGGLDVVAQWIVDKRPRRARAQRVRLDRGRWTMTQYAVIGQSPFSDVAVGAGPFRTIARALTASRELDGKGWNTEIVELSTTAEVETVVNDEGGE